MGLMRKALVLAKEETTYGTDSVPTNTANALLVYNPRINPVGDKVTRDPVRDSVSPSGGIIGSRYAELTFETEYYGGTGAGVAPRYGDLLEACSATETIVASTSVTYKPNSLGTAAKSVSLYAYFDGRLHKLLGAIGNVELAITAGQPMRLRWTFRGLYSAPTSVSVPAPTFEAAVDAPPKAESLTFTYNALSTLVARQLAINLGNQVANRPDVNAATGIKGFVVTHRQGGGTITLESFPPSTYDVFADWVASTLRQLQFVIGTGAGKVLTVTAPKVMIDDIRQGEGDGVELFEVAFSLALNAGDDELSLALT